MSSPLSGFTAVPNPQMLSFMPIQSYLMMYFAGAGWQIGKRKISAIPNDQFNKLSAKDLLEGFTADLRSTIPTLERSLQDITPLVKILIEQYGEFAREIIAATPSAIETGLRPLAESIGLTPTAAQSKGLPTLKQFLSGNPTQAQFLAYAKIFLQQELDRQNATKIGANQDPTKFNAPFKLDTGPTFIGPEINPKTGETTAFVTAVKSLPAPAPHIVERSTSNLSIQSIKLEIKSLEDAIRTLAQRLQQEQNRTGQQISVKRARVTAAFNQLQTAKQNLADFLKMHGSRL